MKSSAGPRIHADRPGAKFPPYLTALTGTPGTGKTAVAKRLRSRIATVEVGPAGVQVGAAWRRRGEFTVDLRALSRALPPTAQRRAYPLLVGHLAHLLPVSDVVVLRCHPVQLRRRLVRSRGETARTLRENVAAEATDVILLESLGHERVWEIDTTSRSVSAVAEEIVRLLTRRPASRFGTVNWLADPTVTDELLDDPR